MSDEAIQQEVKTIRKNYTRTANILFESYPDLRPQEKWLYINLVYLCGAKGTRHLSIRYIHDRTGISLGALSGHKDPEKNDPGMIRRLHNAGLIHAEIKRKTQRDGKESDQPQYHITIVDIWQLNETFFNERCSEDEHSIKEGESSVQNPNSSVQNPNTLRGERSENERERSENDTNIRLHSKTTDSNKITDKNNNPATNVADKVSSFLENLTEEELALLREKLLPKNTPPQEVTPPPSEKPAPPKETGKGKGRRGTTNKEAVPITLQGQRIIELYGSHKGRKVTPTEATIKAANELGNTVASDEDLKEVLEAIDNDPFLKKNKVRTDLDFVFRKYDGFLDQVLKERKKRVSGAPTTDYNKVAGMTDEERAEYKRQKQAEREKVMPKAVREEMMKLTPEDRIVFIRKWKQENQQAALA